MDGNKSEKKDNFDFQDVEKRKRGSSQIIKQTETVESHDLKEHGIYKKRIELQGTMLIFFLNSKSASMRNFSLILRIVFEEHAQTQVII